MQKTEKERINEGMPLVGAASMKMEAIQTLPAKPVTGQACVKCISKLFQTFPNAAAALMIDFDYEESRNCIAIRNNSCF